jgi:hypothetical protein
MKWQLHYWKEACLQKVLEIPHSFRLYCEHQEYVPEGDSSCRSKNITLNMNVSLVIG